MACIVGDETGLLKVVDLSKASNPRVAYQTGSQDRNYGVMGIVPGPRTGDYFVSRLNGNVTLLKSGGTGVPCEAAEVEGTLLPCVIPTALFYDADADQISSVDDQGHVQTVKVSANELGEVAIETVGGFEVDCPNLAAVMFFKDTHWGVCVCVGGRDKEPAVYRIQTGKKVWEAKELPHCSLGLRPKRFPTTANILGNGELFISTGYRELRRYMLHPPPAADGTPQKLSKKDRANFRAPMMNWVPEWLDDVRFFAARPHGKTEAVLADNTGSVYRVDAVSKQLLMKFRGVSGTIRSVTIHPTLPYVASVGLSRRLEVHDLNSGKMVVQPYLKQIINCGLFLPPPPFADKYTHAVDEAGMPVTKEDESNAVWVDMKVAKKRKNGAPVTSAPTEPEAPEEPEGSEESPAPPAKKRKVARRVVKKKNAA
eukprot:TRINITY_DN2081_c0_g2_i1.p1 TRINITY_DN2081_c0_g2~~TRINITY_DN2081_c0_g2_i1.p1  ORF type:complete len:443 (+),score=157.66 TRINITY_DN2081_c0_g2_i1:53-1330(+)